METQLQTMLEATSYFCRLRLQSSFSWELLNMDVAPLTLVSHTLGNGFKWTSCQVLMFPLISLSSSVFMLHQTFHLPCFCSFSPYQPGSHFPLLFFMTSSLGHVPFLFISLPFFSHAKTRLRLLPTQTAATHSLLIILQTRRVQAAPRTLPLAAAALG